jgi:hypothetical protein
MCITCGVACDDNAMLLRHYLTKGHKLRVQEIEDGVLRKYKCKICCKSIPYSSKPKKHRSGKSHKSRNKEAGKSNGESEKDEDMMRQD